MRFTFDVLDGSDPPRPGDVMQSVDGKRLTYMVQAVRPVESRVWHDRWRLEVERIDSIPEGAHVIQTLKYRRGEGPRDRVDSWRDDR